MIKFERQKSRGSSQKTAKNFFKKKKESNDSGTESDGDILDADTIEHSNIKFNMESSGTIPSGDTISSQNDDDNCLPQSSTMLCDETSSHLLYDQHSSEEELEVINGPASIAGAAAAAAAANILIVRNTTSSLISEGGSSSLEPDELFEEIASTSKRSSSTLIENRKRSLAHSSDDELRNFLEPILTPVNFRTTPPMEAFKPNRSHMFRSTTPLILQEARSGIENINLCDNRINNENGGGSGGGNGNNTLTEEETTNEVHDSKEAGAASNRGAVNIGCDETNTSVIKACTTSLKMSNSSHHIYQPQPRYNFHYNSSRSSPASTTGLDVEVRTVSPPAKLFHCAISPQRRPMRAHQHQQQHSTTQRLQRPHRPCLDFDKMQQVSL